MSWYLEVLQKYAMFDGRARRKEYWMFFLINILVSVVLLAIDNLIGTFSPQMGGVGLLQGLYSLAILIPSLAVTVRRLHDTGRTGWWVLISLVPLIGGLILLIFMVLDSEPGTNEYGPNPKEAGYSLAT